MRRIEIRPEAAAALCLLFYLDPRGAFLPFALAATAHEAAHVLAILACGGRVERLRVRAAGAVMLHRVLPPGKTALCALAGPAANAVCAAAFARSAPRFAAVSVLLGAYNLLPIEPLDGGTALRAVLGAREPPDRCDRIMRVVRDAALAALALGALWCALYLRGGVWPLLLLGALLLRLPIEKRVAKRSASA